MNQEKTKNIGIGCGLIILVLITIKAPLLGLILIVVAFGVWIYTRSKKSDNLLNDNQATISKYGEEKGGAILRNELVTGMDSEMVLLAKGKPQNIKKKETATKIVENWYWGEYEYRKTKKYKTYAILENNVLIEFGDV